MKTSDKVLLTYQDVADMLGRSVSAVHDLSYRNPDFPVVKLSAHTHVIPRDLLMDWLGAHAGDGSLHTQKAAASTATGHASQVV